MRPIDQPNAWGSVMRMVSPERSRICAAVLVSLCVSLSGCCKGGGEGGQPGAASLPSAVHAMAPNAPYVRIEGSMVALDGVPSGSTRPIEDTGRAMIVDELYNGLTGKRDARRAAEPASPFAGQVILDCPPETPALVFKAVFLTIAHAGYPHLIVRTSPDAFVATEARLPSVRIFGEDPPDRELRVHVRDTEIALVRRQNVTVTAELSVPLNQRDALSGKVIEELAREPLGGFERDLAVHTDNRTPFSTIAAVFDGLHMARARLPNRSGGRPAYDIVLEGR